MQSLRLRRRLSALVLTASWPVRGAVATAAPATARGGSSVLGEDAAIAIGNVALAPQQAITVDVTYSCDPADELYLGATWRLADGRDSDLRSPRGVATAPHSALTCDMRKHDMRVTLPVLLEDSLPFGEGDPVRVAAVLSNPEGYPHARTEKAGTLWPRAGKPWARAPSTHAPPPGALRLCPVRW